MESKIDVSVGNVSFSGEGDQAWLSEQLDKVLRVAPQIAEARRVPDDMVVRGKGPQAQEGDFTTTLASYIREKKGESNQIDRFLITADWLGRRSSEKLTASAVAKALKDNQQKRLANAADCLNKNVGKGYCEKTDGTFFITPDGRKHLGYTD